ncbi:MAG TPA: transcription-repair coupling factor [Alphaproteobacteria bacterium]|nr:transcription-repair coupling factor [Alphaproteobacteria bacterium]
MSKNGNTIPPATLTEVFGAPPGRDAQFLAETVLAHGKPGATALVHVAIDDEGMARMANTLAFFAPSVEVLTFPAWDCLPYDRSSPNAEVVSRRIATLSALAQGGGNKPRVVVTTVDALIQRVPPPETYARTALTIAKGGRVELDELMGFLAADGYHRADTVMEPGEYAIRGGIVDLYPAGDSAPVRLDLFGDEVESLKQFDPASQRTTQEIDRLELRPVSEVLLTPESIARFREGYRVTCGPGTDDPLYESVSAGHRHTGLEHWLPLFYERLATLLEYTPDAVVSLDPEVDAARDAQLDEIREYYEARANIAARPSAMTVEAEPYHPLPPDHLYLTKEQWTGMLGPRARLAFSSFAAPGTKSNTLDAEGRIGRDFSQARVTPDVNVLDTVKSRIAEERKAGRRTLIVTYSNGARERTQSLLGKRGMEGLKPVDSWDEIVKLAPSDVAFAVLGLEHGWVAPDLALITEEDIFGERLVRPPRKRRKSDTFLRDATALNAGDLVVHEEHGIGRYDGLITIEVAGAPHDCLRVMYDGGDKLFVPVENIEVLSRYGEDQGTVTLDKLGGVGWQSRKARLKQRLRDMAAELLKIAAARKLARAESLTAAPGAYEEFAARFPFHETEDQLAAIGDTLADMASDRPMDRLICGDVGFGKTEVALRAAFVAAQAGAQVAVVTPTTLLCRQHYETFKARFSGFPVRIRQLSRLTTPKDAKAIKEEMTSGRVDIVVGTHSLLAKSVKFGRLGLLIVDEEQHFGVAHKERLKQLRADVHVLTLTATPIPRTLQLALTGVKDMSIIATPPVDRLAVRTFVLPYDPVVLAEAIRRERFRGGQCFYVAPKIKDLSSIIGELKTLVPDARAVAVHGQMPATDIEDVMTRFYNGQYDILVSTNIIESGLDLPNVNTLMVHRSDVFGLAQLYQLRGRVGRGKRRAYAYLTTPPGRKLAETATRRLHVMQSLDSLGAGFTLASHDLDIRGAGNLLGEEQSGHIKEVGIELYQNMLEEAVAELKGAPPESIATWSPQIALSVPVLIPETYVPDLPVRLALYRRIAELADMQATESFAAELADRFGALPAEVENLLEVVALKALCRRAGVEKVDAGPKGAVIAFRENKFSNPAGLVKLIGDSAGTVKLRPDHRLVFQRVWSDEATRVAGIERVLEDLARIAELVPA